MKLADFRIGTRLTFAFGVVVLLSVASAVLALAKLSGIQANLEDIVKDNNVKIAINNDMATSVHIVSRVIRTIVLLEDRAAMDQEMVKITKARADYDKAWESLQKFPASETGKANRARILAARETARPISNKVLELGLANKGAEATALLMKEAGPATAKWLESIDENITFQEKQNGKQHEEAVADYSQARALLVGTNIASVLLAVLFGWLATRSITRPIGAAVSAAERIAANDLSVDIRVEGKDETAQLLGAMAAMTQNLRSIVGTVRTGVDSVSTASGQIAAGNQDLSSRTEEQASALQQTAASMEQLTSTVKQSADNAKQANQLAVSASEAATKGGAVVGQVVATMEDITASSKKIADIISVIDGIAFQTNILALNAAVEAARAGEQGRGFAVVAGEVRNLAQRSAQAAREIKSLINDSVEKVGNGSKQVADAGAAMNDIVTQVKRVTDLIGEITSASLEQSSGIGQVNEAITQMDQVTQQNAALVEQSAAAASSLSEQARKLAEAVAVFKLVHGETRAAIVQAQASSKQATVKRGGGAVKPAARNGSATGGTAGEKRAANSGSDWEEF